MKKHFSAGLLFLFASLNFWAYGQEWTTLENPNYSIDYPTNWELNTSGEMGTSFILMSPQTSESDLFKENVNLLIQDLSEYDLNLEQFANLSKSQIAYMIKESKILESETVTTATPNYFRIAYTGKQSERNLYFIQRYWVIGKKAFVMTFTSEEDVFDEYKTTGEHIMNSFKLKAE